MYYEINSKIFKCAFSWEWFCKSFWFRIFGKGLTFSTNSPILFSERYGYRKTLRLGKYVIRYLD